MRALPANRVFAVNPCGGFNRILPPCQAPEHPTYPLRIRNRCSSPRSMRDTERMAVAPWHPDNHKGWHTPNQKCSRHSGVSLQFVSPSPPASLMVGKLLRHSGLYLSLMLSGKNQVVCGSAQAEELRYPRHSICAPPPPSLSSTTGCVAHLS